MGRRSLSALCGVTVGTVLMIAGAALILIIAAAAAGVEAATPKPPKGVSLSFPPFRSIKCSLGDSAATMGIKPTDVCHLVPNVNGSRILFYNDNSIVSARYQYKNKVQLWKKGSNYAASFSTVYIVAASPVDERPTTFGGGIAFAITPDLRVGASGAESFGLFEVDNKTGDSLRGSATKTVAVEIDMSRDVSKNPSDPAIPHLGFDINSVKSVVTASLGELADFVDHRIAVFIDYNAAKQLLQVRLQKLPKFDEVTKPSKSKAKLYFSRSFRLADYVNEQSFVGFGTRVPLGDNGVYILYDWKFSTTWVPLV